VVAAILGHPSHIVDILFFGVGADIDIGELVIADVGDEPGEVVKAVIDHPKSAAGKAGIAAARLFGGDLEHQHLRTRFARRQRGTGRGVAGPDHDHVELFAAGNVHGSTLRLQSRPPRPVWPPMLGRTILTLSNQGGDPHAAAR